MYRSLVHSLSLCRGSAIRSVGLTACRHSSNVGSLDNFTDEEEMIQQTVQKFSQDEIAPIVKDMEDKEQIPKSLIQSLFDNGFMGLHMPTKYGGSDASKTSATILLQETGKVDVGVSGVMQVQNFLVTNGFLDVGTEEQKEKYLPRLCKDTVGSFCLSEPESGSDAFAMRTTAEKKGDYYVLNGSKMWITNSDIAGIFTVFATVDISKKHKGITVFIVERDTPGFTVGTPLQKLGIKCSGTCPLYFDNVKVPAANVLGKVGDGYKYIMRRLNEGRIGVAASNVGLAEGVLNATVPYLMERKQFNSRLWDFQAIQHQIARLRVDIESSRMLTYNASRLWDENKKFPKQAAMAKFLATEVANQTSSRCLELMGGVGFTRDYPHEKFYRDCKVGPIVEGTNNIQLNTIAAFMEMEEYQ